MSEPDKHLAKLSDDEREKYEDLASLFDEAWHQSLDDPPEIGTFLPKTEPLRSAVLIALVLTDLEMRRKTGKTASVEDYVREFPELQTDPERIVELLRAATEARGPSGYELGEVIGRGQMGIVYKARQVKAGRLVALKMILHTEHASKGERRRFKVEAETQAQLQHPNIVPIYEVGECGAHPFLSMEFVEGRTLAQQIAGTPMAPSQAAALAESLARAAHYAHQRGIVHRDLKPANVLLAAGGVPKITDFGLAKKQEDDSGQTGTEAILGTPSYMAPEQARGQSREVGPAADVYALGAILYECLTGHPPFRAATPLETMELVRSQEPVPPRRSQPKLPRSLEIICLKCLHKDPGKRYMSAAALAEDLQRFQDNKPIKARAVGAWERGRLWARRRPTLVGLIGVVLLAVLALGTGTLVHNARLRDALQEAQHRQAEADRARGRSQATFKKALFTFDRMMTRFGAEQLAPESEMDDARRQFLGDALEYFQDLVREDSADPWVRQETGWAYQRLASIYQKLGRSEEAVANERRALKVQAALAEEAPEESAYRQDVAQSHFNLGELYRGFGRSADAAAAHQKALALREELVRGNPDALDYLGDLGESWSALGFFYQDAGQIKRAVASYRRALDIFKRLVGEAPQEVDYQESLASICSHLGPLYQAAGRLTEADNVHGQGMTAFTNLTRRYPANSGHCFGLAQLSAARGDLHQMRGLPLQAETAFREALTLFKKLERVHPKVVAYRAGAARVFTSLGVVCASVGRSVEALQSHQEALAIYKQLVRAHPASPEYRRCLAYSHSNLGLLACRAGRPADGEKAFQKVRSLLEELTRADPTDLHSHSSLAFCHKNLGDVYRKTGRRDQAETAYQQARGIFERLRGDHPENLGVAVGLGSCTRNLAVLRTETGNAGAALEWYEQARRILEAVLRREPEYADAKVYLSRLHESRAKAQAQLGQHKAALADWERAASLSQGNVQVTMRLGHAVTLARLREYAQAIAEAKELEGKNPSAPATLYGLARVRALAVHAARQDVHLTQTDRDTLAEGYAARAVELLAKAHLAGYFNDPTQLESLRKTADFDALRSRQDFGTLLTKVTPPRR